MSESTILVFDSFYDIDIKVNANEYEIVYAFFQQRMDSDSIAKVFSENLFRISTISNKNVLDLLETFEAQDKIQIVLTMAYYINTLNTNKTVMYGVSNIITPNEKVFRNVVQ